MERRRLLGGMAAAGLFTAIGGLTTPEAWASTPLGFISIEGEPIELDQFAGRPVLVVNTASRCAFTNQYEGLQALYDRYRDDGLVVIGVPSNSFKLELPDAGQVKKFCETNFALDLPLTQITPVTGPEAHPFYIWAAREGVVPRWNFHKILLDGTQSIVAEFPTKIAPTDPRIIEAIERLLPEN